MAYRYIPPSLNPRNTHDHGRTWSVETISSWSSQTGLTGRAGDLGARISLWSGDITKLAVDAIANAANDLLQGRGGVDGVIHRVAGPQLRPACRALGGCPTGQAKMTPGFRLPAKYIIHCVGPIGEHPEALQSTYHRALELCTEHSLKSIAFPCISTGIFKYPQYPAAEVAVSTVLSYLSTHDDIERVIFCVYLPKDREIYSEVIPTYMDYYANQ